MAKKRISSTPKASTMSPPKPDESFDIPAAFTQAPSSFKDFLAPLSPKRIYLLHIDPSSPSYKRQIFLLPIVLNLLILLAIAYRVYLGIHTYPPILASLLGHESPATIDTANSSWSFLSAVVIHRALNFLLDYVLLAIFLPWPVRFLLGPVRWRLAVGFRQADIIVRESRNWSEDLKEGTWIRDDVATMQDRVIPAVTPMRLQKTGYLLIDADWDLDCAAMIAAHKLVDAEKIPLEDFHTCVLVHAGSSKGWLIWRIEDGERDAERDGDAEGLPASTRNKIVAFKDKLSSMGKEDLFYRWVEVIQYESSQPGGFTAERQRNAMLKVKEVFTKDNVDFERFWEEVGGMEGVSI
ncbi:hypothetical protein FQN57_002254 [Myotisia sp. PD_48]|nr:hypothetical protein FQN57_002254 [Myotisia sp. PD_48]